MTKSHTVLVIGATGAQGGSVVDALLHAKAKDGHTFHVRALTRNTESESAKKLAASGVKLVQGDLEDKAALLAAVSGVDFVFGVTNYWQADMFNPAKEEEQLVRIAEVCREKHVKHLVLSMLPNTNRVSHGEFTVPHFDGKGRAWERIVLVPTTTTKITGLSMPFYYENFLSWNAPRKDESGAFSFGFPQGATRLAATSVARVGGVVRAIFVDGGFDKAVVGPVGDDLTCDEYAQIMSEVAGVPIKYAHVPKEVYEKFPFAGADDLAAMFAFNAKYVPSRAADVHLARALDPTIPSFRDWVSEAANKEQLLAKVK